MADQTFRQHQSSASGVPYWTAGSGETVVAIVGAGQVPTRAHALLADHRQVVVFTVSAGAAPQEVAHRIGEALAELGVERCDVLAEGEGAAAALRLTLDSEAEVGAVVLAAPAGVPDAAHRAVTRPVLVLVGTEDESDAADRWRATLPQCNFMFVYGAGRAIGSERPEALAFIAHEFFERRDLFLVSRESGVALP